MATQRERVKRILNLLPYLRRASRDYPDGIPISRIETDTGIIARELVNDIDIAGYCGVPPYSPYEMIRVIIDRNKVYVDDALFEQSVNFTVPEALMLFLSTEILSQGSHPLSEAVKSARNKIKDILSGEVKRRVTENNKKIVIADRQTPARKKLQQLNSAVLEKKEIKIEYFSASRDQFSTRIVRPYGMVCQNGVWYLVAFCTLRNQELVFRVDRIKKLTETSRIFEAPKDFNIQRFQNTMLYTPSTKSMEVKVKFTPFIARWIREEYLPEDITEQRDGSVVVTIRTDSVPWLLGRLLTYGPEV